MLGRALDFQVEGEREAEKMWKRLVDKEGVDVALIRDCVLC